MVQTRPRVLRAWGGDAAGQLILVAAHRVVAKCSVVLRVAAPCLAAPLFARRSTARRSGVVRRAWIRTRLAQFAWQVPVLVRE